MDAAEQQMRPKGADGFSYSDLSAEVGIRKSTHHQQGTQSGLPPRLPLRLPPALPLWLGRLCRCGTSAKPSIKP